MAKHAAGFPAALASRPIRLLRPRDAADVYAANPSVELARLAERGLLQRVAPGYYVVVPADRVDDAHWRPPLVATAWAIAATDYGVDAVAVCGPSAARYHGLIPRELAVAFVAVPKQRPRLALLGGDVTAASISGTRTIPAEELFVDYLTTQLQPGVMSTVGSSNSIAYGSDRAGAVSVNGGRGRANNFSVNGGDANDQFVKLAFT